MEFSKLLEERRSIRKFDPEKKVTAWGNAGDAGLQ